MKLYRETGVVSAQIQAVGASLQIGSTIWGVAPDSWFTNEGRRKGRSTFVGRIVIAAPDVMFELRTRWFSFRRIRQAA